MDILNFFIQNNELFILLIAALGLLVGSFLNVVIYRLPKMIQSEWNKECREYLGLKTETSENEKLHLHLPLSHCIQCKKSIKPWQNIPVLSYLWLRGRCAFCKVAISIRYPIVELLCCFASVYVAWRFGCSWQALGALLFTWI